MNIFFRVDSSSQIGIGHLNRCLVLANELVSSGFNTFFISKNLIGNAACDLIKDKHKLLFIENLSNKNTELQDAISFVDVIGKYEKGIVVVDCYDLGELWENHIKTYAKKIVVLDDLANRRHKCDVLIDQSILNNKDDYLDLIDGDFVFIGGNQIILRKEFWDNNFKYNQKENSIFICMGGADPKNHSQKILEMLLSFLGDFELLCELNINVVIGQANSNKGLFQKYIGNDEYKVNIFESSSNISDLMKDAKFCILSCGTMVLEACALGVPTIGVIIAENQRATAEFLYNQNSIELLQDDLSNFKNILENIINNHNALVNLSLNTNNVIDNSAVSNIVSCIMKIVSN